MTSAHQGFLSITNSQSLLKFMSTESVMPSNHFILCHPLLLLPSIFPSIRVFSDESALHIRWPKYWSFSFSISASNEYSGLISFRMDWLDLLARSYGSSIFNFLSKLQSVFHCGCTNLLSHKQGTRAHISPHLHQYSLFLVSSITAIQQECGNTYYGFDLHFSDD